MPKSTIARLIREGMVLRQQQVQDEAKQLGHGKEKRIGKDTEVKNALNHQFNAVAAKDIQISGLILKNKAK